MRGMTMFFWDQHKTLTNYYEVLTRDVCEKYELTQMEYDILMFLNNNPQHNTAAEIVRIRKSTKSHVSTSLKKLESKGLIQREQSIRNKKYIKITLLDKAEPIVQSGIRTQKQFAKNVFSGVTKEKIDMCKEVFNKICANADECLKKYKELYPDKVKLRVRFSLDNLKLDDDVLNIPLFMADKTDKLIGIALKQRFENQ